MSSGHLLPGWRHSIWEAVWSPQVFRQFEVDFQRYRTECYVREGPHLSLCDCLPTFLLIFLCPPAVGSQKEAGWGLLTRRMCSQEVSVVHNSRVFWRETLPTVPWQGGDGRSGRLRSWQQLLTCTFSSCLPLFSNPKMKSLTSESWGRLSLCKTQRYMLGLYEFWEEIWVGGISITLVPGHPPPTNTPVFFVACRSVLPPPPYTETLPGQGIQKLTDPWPPYPPEDQRSRQLFSYHQEGPLSLCD